MEAGGSSGESPMTRGRRKQEEKQRENEEKARKEANRRKTVFQPRKVIGPRDILVNQGLGKIHLRVDDEDVKSVVKLEETGCDQGQGEGDDVGVYSQEGSVDMQVSEVEHLVKVEDFGIQENAGNNYVVLKGTAGGSEKLLREENQLLKEEIASINTKNKSLERRVQELETSVTYLEKAKAEFEARVNQLEKRDKEELEALIDRKLCERGINLHTVSENTEPSRFLEVQMSSVEPGITPKVRSQEDTNKVTDLFPKVAEIIWNKFGKTMLSSNDFLNARLVCTSWSQGIDKIDNGPCHVLHEKRLMNVPLCCLEHTNEVVKEREATGLLSQTRLEFSIKDSCDEIRRLPEILLSTTWTECKTNLTRLLHKHGSNIQKVDFPSWCSRWGSLGWYSTVVELLSLMPNLKDVSLQGAYTNHAALSNFIDSHPLPKFPKLQHLKSFRLPAPVLRTVLLSNNHITRMDISLTGMEITGIFQMVLLPQLKELQVKMSATRALKCFLDLSVPSLQVLKLSSASYLDWESTDSEIIHKLLKRFQATLVDLELGFNSPLLNSLPELPNLKRLKIRFDNGIYTPNRNLNLCKQLVAFMTGLKYLEFTEYHLCALFRYCSNETFAQRYKLVKTEFVSKLWDLLPELHHVKFSFENCFNCFIPGSKYFTCDFVRASE